MQPEEYIPLSLHTLCNLKPIMFHLGNDYLSPTKILQPPGDNGERLRAKLTKQVVKVIGKADGERFQKLNYILGIDNGKLEEMIPFNQLVDHLEAAANGENKIIDDLYKFRALNSHHGPPKATDPNLKRYKYNIPVKWKTGEKTYEPLSVLSADDTVTCASRETFKNLAKRDKHYLSSLASPKWEMKSSFSWTNLFKSPTSSTLCFGEPTLKKLKQVKLLCNPTSSTLYDPTLAKLKQETEFCITKHIPLCELDVHTGTNFPVPRSSSETNRVSD